MKLTVTGHFLLDPEWNPPPMKALRVTRGRISAVLGPNVALRFGHHERLLDGLLDGRVVTSPGFTGLGDIEDGCAVMCTSNSCRQWALRARRPRVVAKVIGVMADEPRFVLLTQPRLRNAPRGRRESGANRIEAGLLSLVLVEPAPVECAICPGPNTGEVSLLR